MATAREQELVNLCFSLVLHYRMYQDNGLMKAKTQEEVAEWVAYNLKECGYPTTPIGSCWGVLND